MSYFKWKMKSKSLLFFLEGWSNNSDSTRWLPPQKARQSKCIHKCPACQKQASNRKSPSKSTQLLLLRNQEHLLVLSKNRFIIFFPLSNTLKFLSRAESVEVPWSHQGNNSAQLIYLWKCSPNSSGCAQKPKDFSVKAQHQPSHGPALSETLKRPKHHQFVVWRKAEITLKQWIQVSVQGYLLGARNTCRFLIHLHGWGYS